MVAHNLGFGLALKSEFYEAVVSTACFIYVVGIVSKDQLVRRGRLLHK